MCDLGRRATFELQVVGTCLYMRDPSLAMWHVVEGGSFHVDPW